jgi:hypothetical protein
MEKKDWIILGGLAGIGFLYWKLVSGKKINDKKSSFNGSAFGQRVMFTLSNTTNETQVVPLFNSYSNIQNPKVNITPSISEFNRTLLNEPKKVTMIEVRASGNQKQAEQPISVQCKDASGEFKGTNLYPFVSPFQKALDMTSVQPNNLILSGQCYMNYTLFPSQTVVIIVHYEKQTKEQGAESIIQEDKSVKKVDKQDNILTTSTPINNNLVKKESKLKPYIIGGGAVALIYALTRK